MTTTNRTNRTIRPAMVRDGEHRLTEGWAGYVVGPFGGQKVREFHSRKWAERWRRFGQPL